MIIFYQYTPVSLFPVSPRLPMKAERMYRWTDDVFRLLAINGDRPYCRFPKWADYGAGQNVYG
jgi:hypothetical protein